MDFLILNDLRKLYGSAVAVEQFDLRMSRGEFVSFLGPSGSGKTTTMRMVAGFENPDRGTIVLDGMDITNLQPNKRKVGMVFQSYALFPHLTVRDNIGFGLMLSKMPKAEIGKRVDEMLGLIQMTELGQRFPSQLSGGQQQRVALARAIAPRPQVLLLDEPLSALDAKIRVGLRAEIRAIQQALGITTIYVTHDQEEAMSLSDRVVVMSHGRVEQVGTPYAIYNTPATTFVAGFVGTLNVLQGTLTQTGGDTLRIGSTNVRLATKMEGRKADSLIKFQLRPEAITPHPVTDLPGNPALNYLNARVEGVTFLGAVVRMRVNVNDSPLSVDTFNNPRMPPPQKGDTVQLAFDPGACMSVAAV